MPRQLFTGFKLIFDRWSQSHPHGQLSLLTGGQKMSTSRSIFSLPALPLDHQLPPCHPQLQPQVQYMRGGRPPPLDPTSVLETLSSYANDWPRALDFFHWAERSQSFTHTPATYSRTIDILGKHFEFDLAWSLLLRMPSPHPTALRSLLNRYAAAHLVPDALSAFHRSSALLNLQGPAVFHLLIDALCDHRHVQEAQDLCFNDPPFPPDTKTHNILLRGWLKVGAWSKCRDFWEEMDRRGVPKDLRSYSIYMDVLSKSGKPWKALKLYREMRRKGMPIDVVAYNTVIQAAGLSEGADEAIRMYRRMLDSGCLPNAATFNVIIKMLCRAGRVSEAYVFLNQMRKSGCEPDVITYHCFFQYLMRPKEILWLFDRMLASGCRPRLDTYTMLMKKFGRWGFLRPVLMVWKALEENGVTPDSFAYNALIDALLDKGMVEMARKYDEEMLAKGLSAKPRKELGTKGLGAEADDENALSDVF